MNKFPRIFVNWKQRKKQESSASPDDCVTLNHHQPSLVFHGPRVLYRNPAKNYEYAPNLSSSSSTTLSSSTNTSQVIQSDAEPRESVRSLSVFSGNRTSDLGSELSSLKCHSAADEAGSGNGDRLSGARDVGFKVNFTDWHKGRHLGQGSFGKVYEGFNSENGQLCAIKEVKLKSRECLKQLNQEINLLSQLSHPNIVRYYGSELGDETLSIYLEYVYGGSIHKLLQEYGPFKEPVIRNYTRQILSGLVYLHARKTVHRDIKGANILVDPNGGIKLADFGMAKHITKFASVLPLKWNPYYMAPEVVMNLNGYSLAVDIWSLGCTILEMEPI